MITPDELRTAAQELRRRAGTAPSPDFANEYLRLAETYEELALTTENLAAAIAAWRKR